MVEHTYYFEGTYYVTLTVRDASNATGSTALFVDSGNTAPEPAILSPVAPHLFAVGESISLRGRATDAEDGELQDSALTWRVLLHHNTHTHGFIPPTTGNSITFTAPGPENLLAAATSYLEIQLTARDANGLTKTVSQDLRPRRSLLTFASDPGGATVQIGNASLATPVTVSSWVNYALAIEAPSQDAANPELSFKGWSDGGAQNHTILTPASDTTYSVTYGEGAITPPPPPPPPAGGVRTAAASSIETPDFPASNAIDGDPSTRWASTYSDPQWLTIDLGATLNIDRVVLSWEAAYATAYSIQVSDDGSAWQTVYETTSSDGGTDDIGDLGARGRFVRMFGTARATPWGYSLWEFQVFEGGGGGGSTLPGPGAPFSGAPIALPGLIQAENFDAGPNGVAYVDSTLGNSGGEYRTTDVDIELSADSDGYNVGWIGAAEWLQYTVNVGATGIYDLEFRVASAGGGGRFHLEVNGVDRTGALTIPNTGDWQSWTTVTTSVSLTAGQQTWHVVFDAAGPGGAIGNFDYIRVVGNGGGTPPPTTGASPHDGVRTALPGVLQAEAFDDGDAGVAYNDTTSGNSGGEARTGDVDVEGTADTGGGYDVGWIAPGEWLQYSVNVTAAGTYTVEFRVAAAGAGGVFHLEVNGADVTGPLTIPDTGDWQSWTTVSKAGVSLAQGNQTWRVMFDSARSAVGNFNYIRVLAAGNGGGGTTDATPYEGTVVSLPGTVQAERFDEGSASVAYVDSTPGNSGGELRTTDVDIESSSDSGGGYNLGWVEAGEWLRYTVNVTTAGTYDLEVRVASPGSGGTFHLEVNGVDKTGPMTVPNTGGWQDWTTVRASGVTLASGTQVLRLAMDADGSTGGVGNFNWIRVVAAGTQPAIAVERGPYLQQVSDAGAVIAWTTRTLATAAIRFSGPSGAVTTTAAQTQLYSASETGLDHDYYQHEARLIALSPQSAYSYDLLMGGVDVTPGQNHFSTAPPTGSGTVRFIAFGDSGVGSSEQVQLAQRMANDSFDLSLHTGDVAYGVQEGVGAGSYQQYEDWVFGIYKVWMPSRPFFPSIGNHDDEEQSARPYRNVFVLPENGANATYPSHAERYYSFDYGPVHFIALDTETAFLDPAQRQAQLAVARGGSCGDVADLEGRLLPPAAVQLGGGTRIQPRCARGLLTAVRELRRAARAVWTRPRLRTFGSSPPVPSEWQRCDLHRDRGRGRAALPGGQQFLDGGICGGEPLRARDCGRLHVACRSGSHRWSRVRQRRAESMHRGEQYVGRCARASAACGAARRTSG